MKTGEDLESTQTSDFGHNESKSLQLGTSRYGLNYRAKSPFLGSHWGGSGKLI